jgi:hypothetical protein
MAGSGGHAWPAARTVADAKPQNIKECLRTIKLDSQAILDHMDRHQVKTNGHIPRLFKNIVQWCDVALEMPGDGSVDEVNTKVDRILSLLASANGSIIYWSHAGMSSAV